MRIVVASTYVPFLKGGATKIIEDLSAALTTAGHQVETVMIPMYSYWPRVPEQTLAIRLLDLTEACGNRIDRLIAVRYPSYALSHPEKIVWFLHHHRGAYDLWGTPWSDMPDTPEGRAARRMMMQSDEIYLREAKKVYTISRNVSGRLRTFNGIEADGVLYPPLPSDHPYAPGPFGDYFVYISRLCPGKRQDLAIEALRYCRPGPRLVIVGRRTCRSTSRNFMSEPGTGAWRTASGSSDGSRSCRRPSSWRGAAERCFWPTTRTTATRHLRHSTRASP